MDNIVNYFTTMFMILGLHFHVVGEGVVRVRTPRQERVYDKENYIDFRMRLLGEPGKPHFSKNCKRSRKLYEQVWVSIKPK